MRIRFTLWITLFIASLLVFAVTACTPKKNVEKIRLSEVTRSIFYTPQYVALEKGFFTDEGLDVELKTAWGGDKAMTALLSNSVDIALVGAETSIYVYTQGTNDPIINFAQLTQTDGTFLLAREKTAEFNWEQLKGAVFLGQRKGGMPQMVGEYVLKKHGIDPHHDLSLIQSIDFGNVPNAFASGTGDYVQLFEPTASIFEQEGIGHIVASFGEESGQVPYTTFMAKQSFLKEKPETIEKFVRGIYRGEQWVQNNEPKVIAEVVAPYFDDIDADTIAMVIERYKKQESFATNLLLTRDGWNHLQLMMKEANELSEEVPYETLVNTKMIDKVMKE